MATVEIDKSLLAKLLGKQGSKRRKALAVAGKVGTVGTRWGVIQLLIGAVAAYVVSMDSVKKSEWLKKNWWVLPAALALGGFLLHRKRNPYGGPMMLLGGFLGYQAYQNRTPEPAKAVGTSGLDTGYVFGPGYGATGGASFSPAIPAGHGLFQLPNGQQIIMPLSQAANYGAPDAAATLSNSIFQQRRAA